MPALAVDYVLNQESTIVPLATRGASNTTYFGWDSFEDPAPGTFLSDTTPDIGTAVVGAKFETTNGQLHRASSGNFYAGSTSFVSQTAEKITVVTNGTVGSTGKTTVVAQLVGTGAFPSTWTFSNIDGVAPQVFQITNKANKGQAWVKWELPGNAATYEFTLGSVAHVAFGGAHMSFDKIEIDTFWSADGASIADTMIRTEPTAIASILEQLTDFATPSSRGGTGTTYFGWDNFQQVAGPPTIINDNTPDIGSDPSGLARFRTANEELHQAAPNGNLYFYSGGLTLDEEVTVPSNGVVGEAGYTTIILQIASAASAMGGAEFADEIHIGAINGVAPTVVQGKSANTAQLWAKWVLPGNQATYTIDIDGEPNTPHYSISKVIVDTKYSRYAPVGDTVRLKTVEISTSVLATGIQGTAYSAQLAATGGTTPHTWSVKAGSTLPAGLELSSAGLISGTPTATGESTFTIVAEDGAGYKAEAIYTVDVVTPVVITNTIIPKGVVSVPYFATLQAEGALGEYEWTLSSGTLPAGLSLSEAGLISGTPTSAGTVTIGVLATDVSGATATKSFELKISNLSIVTAALPIGVINVDYAASVQASGGVSPYTWEITAGTLPTGVTLNAETGVISGKPTVAASSTLTIKVTDDEGLQISKNIDLAVTATFNKPVVDPITFPTATIGATYSHTVTASNYPKTFTITGLPRGLTYVAATGVISGRPSVSGAYQVQVRATNTGGASVIRPATLVVKALPASLVGSFTGLVSRNTVNTGLGSLFNLTTTTTGAYTLQVKSGSATKSVKGFLNVSAPQVVADLGGSTISLSVNLETALIAGTQGEATVHGWRTKWDATFNPASGREGYYSVALNLSDEDDLEDATLPQGTGFATFSVVPAGTLKIAGKTADGQAITASTALGPNGEIAFYSTAYANKGTVLGKWTVEDNDFIGNTVEGELSWQKPATTGLTYPAAFGPLDVTVAGGYLAPSAKGPVMAGLPDEGSIEVTFEAGGIDTYGTFAEVNTAGGFGWTEAMTVTAPSAANNPGAVTLKINKATGAVTGTFTATEGTLVRKNVAFQGQIVTLPDGEVKAAGYFLLPQIPTGSEKPTTSPVLSGSVFVVQPAASPAP